MKKYLLIIGLFASVSLLSSGCAVVSSPVLGIVYTSVKAPVAVTSNDVGTKVGTGEATSILGIAATGDASIQTAARNAGITKISHVDYESFNVLGLFARITIYVYGE